MTFSLEKLYLYILEGKLSQILSVFPEILIEENAILYTLLFTYLQNCGYSGCKEALESECLIKGQ